MTNLNQVILNGNLTKDVEVSYSKNGTAFGKFTIAVNKSVKEGEEWKNVASFFDVKLFGKLVEYNQQHLKKGTSVTLVGSLNQETWQDKETGKTNSKIVINAEKIYPTFKRTSSEPKDNIPKSEEFQEDFPF